MTPQMRRWTWAVWSSEGPRHVAQRAICQVLFEFLVSSPDNRIFPSEATIAEKVGVSERRVQDHIKALVADGWIRRRYRGQGGKGWRCYEYNLLFPPHIDPSKDKFLQACERKRIDAIDDHRIAEEWHPRDEAEADRRAAKGDPLSSDYLLDSFDTDRYPRLDIAVFYRLAALRREVASLNSVWMKTSAGQLSRYPANEQDILVDWVESNDKSSLPSHATCRAILNESRAAA